MENLNLKTFLYMLLRDELPSGKVMHIIHEIRKTKGIEVNYTNKHIANLAQDIANELMEK